MVFSYQWGVGVAMIPIAKEIMCAPRTMIMGAASSALVKNQTQ